MPTIRHPLAMAGAVVAAFFGVYFSCFAIYIIAEETTAGWGAEKLQVGLPLSFLAVPILGALAWRAYREAGAFFRFALSEPPASVAVEVQAEVPAPAPSAAAPERSGALQTRTSTGTPDPAPAPASATAPPIRETLVGRKYELDHHIGEGGMGLVYAGRDLELGRFVAIKKMRPELKLNARDKKRFMQEANLSAALHHPCIVEIYDIAEQNGDVYLIFEFVDGETMDKRLDIGPMKVEELRPLLKYVCQALEFAHSKKVVHRDLKPSNIMLTRQGFAKVVDFGIAREIKDTVSRLTNMDTSGTLAYMAPEQELGKFDARSDIYSLGVTLYEAICLQHPFPGPNYLLQKEKMVFMPLAEAAPQAPKDFCDAIERCLRYDPKDRYQSVAEFARAAGVS
jgi:serine/threonine-protein kinase